MNAKEIREFLNALVDERNASIDQEKQLLFTMLGNNAVCVSIESIRSCGDDLLVYDGEDFKHRPTTVVQHMSQVNFLITTWDRIAADDSGKVLRFEPREE